MRDQRPNVGEGFGFILAAVIGHATDFIVGGRAAERFVVNRFANGGFDQVASRQENRAGAFHDDALVAHDGQVGAACHATAHHSGNLRNARRGEARVVAEHPSKVLFVRKDLVLHGQVHAGAVDEVDDGESVFEGDLLGAEVFLACDGEPRTGFHRGVIGHHKARLVVDAAHFDHHSACGAAAFILVHAMTCQGADFEPFASWVKQPVQAFARRPFSLGVFLFDPFGASALAHLVQNAFQVGEAHAHAVFVEILRQLFVLRHDSKVRRGPTFEVMCRAPLRGLGWLCLVGILLLGCQPATEEGDAVKAGWIQPKHAKGFAWAVSDQGQTTLVLRQPRTGKVLATVSAANSRDGVEVRRTYLTWSSTATGAS